MSWLSNTFEDALGYVTKGVGTQIGVDLAKAAGANGSPYSPEYLAQQQAASLAAQKAAQEAMLAQQGALTKPFDWKPVMIGGAVLAVIVVVALLFKRK